MDLRSWMQIMEDKFNDQEFASREWLEAVFPGLKLTPWSMYQEWSGGSYSIKFYPTHSTILSVDDKMEEFRKLRRICASSLTVTVDGLIERKGDIRRVVALFDREFASKMN